MHTVSHRLVLVLCLTCAGSVGCAEKTVELSGRVYRGLEQNAVASDAPLEVLSFEEELLGETRTDADGFFALQVPEDVNVFLRIDDADAPSTTFAGVVSLFDEQIADGYLFTVPDTDVAALEARYAGCPVGAGPGVVVGEVRHQDLLERDGSNAINTASQVKLLLDDGSELVACYLDDDGEAYAPESLLTGPSGQFAFFGVPAGAHSLEVAFDVSLQLREVQQYPVLVLDGPSVSPWFPAWVTMPL